METNKRRDTFFITFIDCEITWQFRCLSSLNFEIRNITQHKRLMEMTNSDLNKSIVLIENR